MELIYLIVAAVIVLVGLILCCLSRRMRICHKKGLDEWVAEGARRKTGEVTENSLHPRRSISKGSTVTGDQDIENETRSPFHDTVALNTHHRVSFARDKVSPEPPLPPPLPSSPSSSPLPPPPPPPSEKNFKRGLSTAIAQHNAAVAHLGREKEAAKRRLSLEYQASIAHLQHLFEKNGEQMDDISDSPNDSNDIDNSNDNNDGGAAGEEKQGVRSSTPPEGPASTAESAVSEESSKDGADDESDDEETRQRKCK